MRIDSDARTAVRNAVQEDYGPSLRSAGTLEELHTIASHIRKVWGDIPGKVWGQKHIDRAVARRRRELMDLLRATTLPPGKGHRTIQTEYE